MKQALPAPETGAKLLVPGCGDSLLSEKLALKMGYQNVVSIDFEPEVVSRMQQRGVTQVAYEVMDILDLKYPAASF